MKIRSIPALLLVAALPSVAQDAGTPKFSGYITRIASTQDFDLNGRRIQVTEATKIYLAQSGSFSARKNPLRLSLPQLHPYIGEPADIYGELTTREHGLAAMRIVLSPRAPHAVSGSGVIDSLPALPANASGSGLLVRADGYLVLITPATHTTFIQPLTSSADIATNKWLHFQGTQRTDGIVVANNAYFSMNVAEAHAPEDTQYDPAAIPADNKQSGVSRAIRGIAPRQIPPTTDAAMQVRVSAIGAKLIPGFQSSLPASDPTRINFRFQVLKGSEDVNQWRDAALLPDGVILVPQLLVERLQNDSQVAAVLARSIACALEKQTVTGRDRAVSLGAAELATGVASLVIPVIGIAGSIGSAAEKARIARQDNKSGRVSLGLLHDAGYDIDQAPIAWWLLAPEKPQPLDQIPLPPRAEYLYKFLGESWPEESAPAPPAEPSVASSTSAPVAPR